MNSPALQWIEALRARTPYRVRRSPLSELPKWGFDEATGDLEHESGKFFAVRGLRVGSADATRPGWSQPIIDQPETGILGIIVRRNDRGTYDYLLQAKMEPGNINLVQFSPTLQATYSNFTRVHGGKTPHYLDYFDGTIEVRAITDTLQPETGSRFLGKQNRNVIIEIDDEAPVVDGFRWVPHEELSALLLVDDAVNMDARSVLSTMPNHRRVPTVDLRRRLEVERAACPYAVRVVPLEQVPGWVVDGESIRHESENYFEVVGVDVVASEREVGSWGQPLLLHRGVGLAALFSQSDGDERQYLVQTKFEPGNRHLVEFGPTIATFDFEARAAAGRDIPFLSEFLEFPEERMISTTVQSEEGGRFWDLRNRYVVPDVTGITTLPMRDGFLWMTRDEIKSCLAEPYVVNSELRTLLLYADLAEGAWRADA